MGVGGNDDRMGGMSRFFDVSVETIVFVSGVVYGAGGAVRFNQLVVAFNFIAITFLSLLLDVMSVWILHSVLELVLGVFLRKSGKLIGIPQQYERMFCDFMCLLIYGSHSRNLVSFVLLFDHSRDSHHDHRLGQQEQLPTWREQQQAEIDINFVSTLSDYNGLGAFSKSALEDK